MKKKRISKQAVCLSIIAVVLVTLVFVVESGILAPEPKIEVRADNCYGRTLKVASDAYYRPYVYYNDKGVLSGLDVEQINIIANKLNMNVEMLPMTWSDALKAAREGRADLLLTCESGDDPAYPEDMLLSVPLHSGDFVVFGIESIESVDDLYGKRIGLMKEGNVNSTIYNLGLKEFCTEYDSNEKAFEAVANGECDYVVARNIIGEEILNEMGSKGWKIQAFVDVASSYISIGITKNNTELKDKIDAVIYEMKNDGTASALRDKWLTTFVSPNKLSEILSRNLWLYFVILILLMLTVALYYRRKERELDLTRTEELIQGFIRDYEAVFFGNIDEEKFRILQQKDETLHFDENQSLFVVVREYCEKMVHPNDRQLFNDYLFFSDTIKSLFEVGKPKEFEYRRRKDGDFVWYKANINRINESDFVVGLSECEDEVNLRVATEQLLSEYDALYIVNLDSDEVRAIKKSTVTSTGVFAEKIRYSTVAQKFAEEVDEAYREEWTRFCDVDYLTEYLSNENHREYVYILPSAANSMRRVVFDVIERREGVAQTVLMSFMAIDEERSKRIQLDHQLARQKILLDYFINSYDSAYFVNLEDDTFEVLHMEHEFSQVFVQDGSRDDMDRFIEEHIHPEDRELMKKMIQPGYVSEKLKTEPFFTFIVREEFDGAEKIMRCLIIRGIDELHVAVGFMDITEEINEEKEMQENLREALLMARSANAAKTIFLNNMSHDIRTPMNAIIGFTNLARTHINETDKVEDYLKKIGQSSDHLLSLINEVLDMSRIESGKMSLDEEEESLSEIIYTLRDIVHVEVRKKSHDFAIETVNIGDDIIMVDKLKLDRVLLNVVSNSIKYTPNGGSITLRVTKKEIKKTGYATYEFVIKDNGIGMSKEYLDTIFVPFSREKTSTVSGIQGSGLGMAITKNIVEMMGGTIEIESQKDKGTVTTIIFDFRLAGVGAGLANVQVDTTEEEVKAVDFSGRKVLLVEDNELNREIATEIMEEEGIIVDTAEDGNIAVEKLKNAKDGDYDIVLMDIQMPNMDGLEATGQIRALGGPSSNLPIIAMTANAFEEDRISALEAGMDDYITKPIDIDILRKTMAKYIPIELN